MTLNHQLVTQILCKILAQIYELGDSCISYHFHVYVFKKCVEWFYRMIFFLSGML